MSGVHITLRRGEMLGLAGLLGSGRSETARLLFGADRPDTGEIRVDGQQVRLGAPRRAIRLGFGYCTEERKADGVCPSLSVRENLLLALQARRGPLRRLSTTEQFQLVNHYIQSLDIRAPSPETPLRMLSGGNQQKVLLARWLILQPRLLILDEPTRGIDVGAKQEIAAIVHQLRSEGLAVIFISSELEEVARLCQRVLVLRDRRPAGELQGEDVTEDRIMQVIAG